VNKDVREKWVAALRSGEYKQGRSQLRFQDKFCCLGVLCELAVKEEVISSATSEGNPEGDFEYAGSSYLLPYEVSEWAGLGADDAELRYNAPIGVATPDVKHFWMASSLNDKGVPFTTIADLIEEQL
jgi:hypothetical protein